LTRPVSSHEVRVRGIRKYKGVRGTTYTVRWRVAGRDFQRTFATAKLADTFRSELLVTAREGRAFDPRHGLPIALVSDLQRRTWYEHAMEFMETKWPHAAPRHRKGLAEALVTLTVALTTPTSDAPPSDDVRRALFRWSFNIGARESDPPDEFWKALAWVERQSLPLSEVQLAPNLRKALDAIALKLDGAAAASSTVRRKRSAFYSALQYAVELELIDSNPLDRISWKAPVASEMVDRRVVVNPSQARALLAAVRDLSPAVEGFFACLYYAGLRPSEAVNLREKDCLLPESGWGELVLIGSHQTTGRAWTDSGDAGEERGLKHRSRQDTRHVPAHPELVAILRRHVEQFMLGPDGRLFVSRTGKRGVPLPPPYSNPLSMGTAYRVWHKARAAALTPGQVASPLARRPYDLRHACLSTWLNAGVPATQVAEWAGHSVNVLLKVYAKCLDGQDEAAKRRIEQALALN
jgi:integrase